RNSPCSGCDRCDLDGIAEAPESGDQAVGLGGFGAAVEVSRAQILVEGAVPEHGIGGREDGSGDRADGFPGAATGAQAVELGLQVGSLRPRCRPGALDQGGLQPRRPLSHAGGPPLAGALVVLGTKPGPGDQMAFGRNRPMSTPISAAMTSALSWLTPGIVLEDSDRCAKGLDVGVDLLVNLGDGGVDGVDVLKQQAQSKAMMLGHTAPQRGLQFGRCRFDPPMRQRRQRLRIGLAADQGLDHPPAGQADDVGDDRIELDVASSSVFWRRWIWLLRSRTNCLRIRRRLRISWVCSSGTKLPRMSPCAIRSASQVASFTSVLRPGTFFTCAALASTSSNSPSGALCKTL